MTSMTIKRKEFLFDKKASSSDFDLDGGVDVSPTIFPWAAAFARNYEFYHIDELEFRYIPTTGTTEKGYIAMFLDFDPSDDAPSSKRQFLNQRNAVAGPAWQRASLRISASDLRKKLYTNPVSLSSAQLRQNSAGRFYFARGGQQDTGASMGEIWVHYKLRYTVPQIPSTFSPNTLENFGAVTYGEGTTASPLGNRFEGALPATIGQGSSTIAMTFTEDWSGMFSMESAGTDLQPIRLDSFTGSANLSTLVVKDNNTTLYHTCAFSATAGTHLVLEAPCSTITNASWYWMRGPYLSSVP
jgi:hypothetical protein